MSAAMAVLRRFACLAIFLPMTFAAFPLVTTQSHLAARFPGQVSRRPQTLYKKRQICAVALPGDSIGEEIFVNGFANFANIFQNVLVFRVLLSWFPAAQGVGVLQPVFNVCDPYLNAFRGILPPIFGIDFSPFLAFAVLQAASGSMVALGAPLPATPGQTLRAPAPKPKYSAISLERMVAEGLMPWQLRK